MGSRMTNSGDISQGPDKDVGRDRGLAFSWESCALGAAVGGILVLCAVAFFAGLIGYSVLPRNRGHELAPGEVDGRAELSVAADGCTVVRSEVTGSTQFRMVDWVVADSTGRQVLRRDASEEYEYTYYRPGTYTVHLEGWHGGGYIQISNEVEIHCHQAGS